MNELNGINVLSCFDGISAGQLALKRAGIKINKYFSSEIDKYAIKITQKNFPDTIQLGDINNWKEWDLPKIDIIIGGGPCQGFSMAGKGLNFNDPRSKLFFVFIDILQYYNPKYFLFENVKMKKEWRNKITDYIGVEPIEINSALVSGQSRKRLYWTNIPDIQQPKDKGILLKDIIESGDVGRKYDITERFYKKIPGTLSFYKSRQNLRNINQKSNPLLVRGHNISNTGSTNIIFTDNYIRILTPLECERLQNIPDGYTDIGLSDSKRYYVLGNGWTVDVIAHIFSYLPEEYKC